MNTVKHDILRDALRRIALASGKSDPVELAHIATVALKDAAAVVEYRITGRTWYGRNGGEFAAEVCRTDTGEKLVSVRGTQCGSDAWAYALQSAMMGQRPDLFPPSANRVPSLYWREVLGVQYEHAEVSRKRDL